MCTRGPLVGISFSLGPRFSSCCTHQWRNVLTGMPCFQRHALLSACTRNKARRNALIISSTRLIVVVDAALLAPLAFVAPADDLLGAFWGGRFCKKTRQATQSAHDIMGFVTADCQYGPGAGMNCVARFAWKYDPAELESTTLADNHSSKGSNVAHWSTKKTQNYRKQRQKLHSQQNYTFVQ